MGKGVRGLNEEELPVVVCHCNGEERKPLRYLCEYKDDEPFVLNIVPEIHATKETFGRL